MENGVEEEGGETPISLHMQTGGLERGYKVLQGGSIMSHYPPLSLEVKAHGRSRTSLKTGRLVLRLPRFGVCGAG